MLSSGIYEMTKLEQKSYSEQHTLFIRFQSSKPTTLTKDERLTVVKIQYLEFKDNQHKDKNYIIKLPYISHK